MPDSETVDLTIGLGDVKRLVLYTAAVTEPDRLYEAIFGPRPTPNLDGFLGPRLTAALAVIRRSGDDGTTWRIVIDPSLEPWKETSHD